MDVEVIKKFDNDILSNEAFFGLETENTVNTGLGFGATKKNWIIKEMLDDYNDKKFLSKDGKMDMTPCPIINSRVFRKNGFELNGNYEKINDVSERL